MESVFQFLVLAFTALVWWLARRDLTALAAQARTPAKEELASLRATVEELTATLEQRAEAAEGLLSRRIAETHALIDRLALEEEGRVRAAQHPKPTLDVASPEQDIVSVPVEAAEEVLVEKPKVEMPVDERYAKVAALVAAGVTDSTEIARRTGMGRGEVELIIGLRARHVL